MAATLKLGDYTSTSKSSTYYYKDGSLVIGTATNNASTGSAVAGVSYKSGTYSVSVVSGMTSVVGGITDNDGKNSRAWSVTGGSFANLTNVKLGSGADSLGASGAQMVIGKDVTINLGDGNNQAYVSLQGEGSNTITLGSGADVVSVSATNGALTINAGEGANTVSVGTAEKDVTINGGTGKDDVNITSVKGALTLKLSDGYNTADVTSVAGALTYTGGDGTDSVTVQDVGGGAKVDLGDGSNTLTITGSVAGGKLEVTGGSGADSVDVNVAKSDVKLTLGAGTNNVSLGSVQGATAITGGASTDNVTATSLTGAVTVDLGDGANMFSVEAAGNKLKYTGGSSTDNVTIGSVADVATITGGEGHNTVSVGTASKDLTITGGSSTDIVSIGDASGKLNITAGAGGDTITIDKASIAGSTFDLGAGNDQLTINELGNSLAGAANINAGAGDDVVSIKAASLTSATIDLGDGANKLFLKQDSLGTGTLKITGGAGADTIETGSSLAGAAINIDLGNGANVMNGVSLNSGKVTLNGGSGSDSFTVTLAQSLSSGSFNLGAGNDVFSVTGESLQGTIDMGAGKDTVYVANATDKVTITGSGNDAKVVHLNNIAGGAEVKVTVGNGADNVSLGGTASIKAAVTLGDGADTLYAGNLNSSTITGGNGAKTITIASLQGSTITLGAGADTVSLGQVGTSDTITLGDGNDSLTVTNGVGESTKIDLGAGNDTVGITGDVAKGAVIDGGEGNDSMGFVSVTSASITGGAGADTINVSKAQSATISGGEGDDLLNLVSLESSTIDLGAGNDSLVVTGTVSNATIKSGDGADYIDLTGMTGTATITDFTLGTDFLKFDSTAPGFTAEGIVGLSAKASVQAALSSNGYYAITGGTDVETAVTYAWSGDSKAANINASSFTDAVVLSGVGSKADTLKGGSGDDTITAYEGDFVYGGKGNNAVSLASGNVSLGFSANGGSDTVSGTAFAAGWETEDGEVYLFENTLGQLVKSGGIEVDGANVTFTGGKASMTITTDDTDGNGYVDLKVRGKGQSKASKIRAVNGTATITNVETLPDYYYAASTDAALDFSGVSDDLIVDLGNTGKLGDDKTNFSGVFATVKGGSGDKNIISGSAKNSENLIAGSGATTLWGGGLAADTLTGHGTSGTSRVTYVYGSGDGADTIESANWGIGEANDVISITGGIKSVTNNGTDTVLNFKNSTDTLVLAGETDADKAVQFTTNGTTVNAIKVGVKGANNDFTYDSAVNYYFGSTGTDTLKVAGSDNVKINLASTKVHFSSIDAVDASEVSGTTYLFGGKGDETLTAGSGGSTLYGAAGNDTLVGGDGTDVFGFMTGTGSDVILNSSSDDKVLLYNVTSTKSVKGAKVTEGVLNLTFTDGSTLAVNDIQTGMQFQLGHGSSAKTYVANLDSSTKSGVKWTKA